MSLQTRILLYARWLCCWARAACVCAHFEACGSMQTSNRPCPCHECQYAPCPQPKARNLQVRLHIIHPKHHRECAEDLRCVVVCESFLGHATQPCNFSAYIQAHTYNSQFHCIHTHLLDPAPLSSPPIATDGAGFPKNQIQEGGSLSGFSVWGRARQDEEFGQLTPVCMYRLLD